MDPVWKEHFDALGRFNCWEQRQLRDRSGDYSSALAWLSEAWELAERHGPPRDPRQRREKHLQDLVRLRDALERARLAA